jgi:hypothetical protein
MTLIMDSIEYKLLHRKIWEERGSAFDYDCVKCNHEALDWAHIHGTDDLDVYNYQPMCRSCHMLYDNPTRGSKHGASILAESDVCEILAMHAVGMYKVGHIAEKYGVARQTITNIITGQKWGHVHV